MPQTFDEPFGVVPGNERRDDRAGLLEAREASQVRALLLSGAHEALGHAVPLRFTDVGGCERDPQPLHLVDPRVGDVLGPPVTAHPQAARDILAEPAEGVPDALADRFERGPAIAELRHVPAEQLVGVKIDCAEEPAPALSLSVEAGAIGP